MILKLKFKLEITKTSSLAKVIQVLQMIKDDILHSWSVQSHYCQQHLKVISFILPLKVKVFFLNLIPVYYRRLGFHCLDLLSNSAQSYLKIYSVFQ